MIRWLVVLCVLVAGCGASPKRDTRDAPVVTAPVKPAPIGRSGGYYLDDGPGLAGAPSNLDAVPDAVPRVEPLARGALRPYTVMGRHYTPMTALQPYKARGVASWYGRRYHGKQTSSGEVYDMYAMTAAHTTLPLPSYARVTNLANGKSVVVRVNDRGPFIDNRLIDLSYTAAHRLGTLSSGSAMVEVELIIPGVTSSVAAPVAPAALAVPAVETEPQIAVATAGAYLQLAAFGSRDNAEAYVVRLGTELAWLNSQIMVSASDGLFRVQAGPFASAAEAREAAARIGQSLNIKPWVITK